MTISVDLPKELVEEAERYAAESGKTIGDVVRAALDGYLAGDGFLARRLFGAVPDKNELDRVQAVIDEEFRRVSPEEWK